MEVVFSRCLPDDLNNNSLQAYTDVNLKKTASEDYKKFDLLKMLLTIFKSSCTFVLIVNLAKFLTGKFRSMRGKCVASLKYMLYII